MSRYGRHTLIYLNLSGRERIFAELTDRGYNERAIGEMLLPERYHDGEDTRVAIPGIVRRMETRLKETYIPLGFTSWRSSVGGRLRVAAFALPAEISGTVTPEEVAAKAATRNVAAIQRTPALTAFTHLCRAWHEPPLRFGLWGSAAMEVETGYLYTHQRSDLDMLVLPAGPVERKLLTQFLNIILTAEKKFGIRIDVELLAPGGYGISLKELLDDSVTALGKGLADVVLVQKSDVFTGLMTNRQDRQPCRPSPHAKSACMPHHGKK